jgi:hypothetical protein
MPSDLNRLEFDLQQAGLIVAHRAGRVIRKAGYDTVRDGQALCPVKTGNLRSSIGIDFDTDGMGWEAGPTARYGIWVEQGTSRMAPRAYLGPAFDRNVPAVVRGLEQLGGTFLP